MIPASEPAAWQASEDSLRGWVDGLLAAGAAVIAPVEVDEGLLLFREIAAAGQAQLEAVGTTRWSPKEHLLPRCEPLYRYHLAGGEVRIEDAGPDGRPRVLLGVRPCDAAGIARLDAVFLAGQPDPHYRRRRERTTVVSLACARAAPECFCTAVGGSPTGEEGSDLQLVPLGDGWLIRALSRAGERLVAGPPAGLARASEEALEAARELDRRVAGEIHVPAIDQACADVLERGFEDPMWERVAATCLGCGLCAAVCPSCSCFDMNHQGDAWRGEQIRTWDSCGFALFTRHASGHNPRASRSRRYRQRLLHKFAYRQPEGAAFRCVGCGRCVALCPGGVDIADELRQAVEELQGGGDGAAG